MEILCAMALFVTGILGFIHFQWQIQRQSQQAQRQLEAAIHAQSALEKLSACQSSQTCQLSAGDEKVSDYQIHWQIAPTAVANCSGITVTVSWKNRQNQTEKFQLSTQMALEE